MVQAAKQMVSDAVEAVRGYFHPAKHVEEKRPEEWYQQRNQATAAAELLTPFLNSDVSAELNKRLYAEYQRQYAILAAAAPTDSIVIAKAQARIEVYKFCMELPARIVEEGKIAQAELDEEKAEQERAAGLRRMEADDYAAI
jgi:hypothetical protein